MDTRDRNNLLALLYGAGIIGATFLFSFLAKKITNVLIPFGILMAVQQLYVIPKFVEKYRLLYDYDTGIVKYIPVINEMKALSYFDDDMPMRSNFFSISYLVLSVIFVLCLGATFLDPNIIATILPHESVLNFSNMAIYSMILVGLILSGLRGAGYCKLIYDIQSVNEDFTGIETNAWDLPNILSYVTVFIPGMRTLGLLYQLNTLTKLVDLNDYVVNYEEDDYDDVDYDYYGK